MKLHVLLVRHGETDWNAEGRYQGQSDLPLNQRGVEQVRLLAGRIGQKKIDAAYSSDLQRAMQTATILVGDRGIPVQPEPRLREMNFGVLEGHTFDEAQTRWPEMIQTWLGDYNQPPEGGERLDDFSMRIRDFCADLKDVCNGKTALLVAHGGTLREILKHALQPPAPSEWWFSFDHASLTELTVYDKQVVINCLNDSGHLYG